MRVGKLVFIRLKLLHQVVLFTLIFYIANPAVAGIQSQVDSPEATCPPVNNTPYFTLAYGQVMIGGALAPVGMLVEAYDPRGNRVGCFSVTSSGNFGAMFIYGEDPSVTPAIPGMKNNEIVVFHVDGKPALSMPALVWLNDKDVHEVNLTDLSIQRSGNDVLLSWYAYSTSIDHFEVWRSNTMTFLPGDTGSVQLSVSQPPTSPGMLSYTDAGAWSSTTSSYYYLVRSVSTAAKASISNRTGKQVISFAPGWNLIAIPLQTPSAYTARLLLTEINDQTGSCSEVDRLLNGAWNAHLLTFPPTLFNFSLLAGQGYFIKCNLTSIWTYVGFVRNASVPISLSPGWNLISIPYPISSYTARTLLISINNQGGNCTEVNRWFNSAWSTHSLTLPPTLNNFLILPEQGYFVRCSLASTFIP